MRARWAAIGAATAVSLGAGGFGIVNAMTETGGTGLVLITPCRLADTRTADIGTYDQLIVGGATLRFAGRGEPGNCILPANTTGLSVNLTAVGATANTFFTLFPSGTNRPLASHLNPSPVVEVTTNGVDVALGSDGNFDLYSDAGSTNVIIDVLGVHVPNGELVGPAGPKGDTGAPGAPGKPGAPGAPGDPAAAEDLWWIDADGDGFGSNDQFVLSLTQPVGYVDNNDDCDDAHASANPDGEEIPDNGLDDDCSGGSASSATNEWSSEPSTPADGTRIAFTSSATTSSPATPTVRRTCSSRTRPPAPPARSATPAGRDPASNPVVTI